MNHYLIFVGIGTELLGIILSMAWLGIELDDYFGTKGLMVVFLSILGLISWLLHLIYLVKTLQKREKS